MKKLTKQRLIYLRYILPPVLLALILLVGSLLVIYNSVLRIITPSEINYNGMIIFAIVGVVVNFGAAFLTREGDSLNQKAVNLHMLEDVFGWIVVLVGALVMRFTDITLIDPLMSVGVSVFIIINAIKNHPYKISISEYSVMFHKAESEKGLLCFLP